MAFLKHLLIAFPKGFFSALILNGSIMAMAYWLFWVALKKRLSPRRIQLKQRVNNAQIKRELKNALFTFAVSALFGTIVLYAGSKGITRVYTDIHKYNPLWIPLDGILLLLIDDTWFYWTHRLLHLPFFFRYIHREHHKSIDTNPFTSASFHFLEPVLLTLWIFPVAILIPIYSPVLILVQAYGLYDNLKSHLGYELYSPRLNRSWFRFLTTSTHHNMHHARVNGNYGVHFRFWDRAQRTEFTNYEEEYANIHRRNKIKS